MGTYYGYVDRDVDQQINWQTIGESIAKPFLAREEQLKKEHAAVAKNTRDILTDLNNPELGENRNANTLIIDGSVKLSEQQKAYDTLYRQGAISYNEYLQNSQNVKDQATMFSKIPQLWNEKQKDTMAKLNAGEVDAAQSKGYQLLQDIFINPNVAGIVVGKNGNLYLGKKEVGPDGTVTITKDPNNLQSLSSVTSMLGTFNIPKFDVQKEWTKTYSDLKTKSESIIEEQNPTVSSDGKIKILNDIYLNNESFRESLKKDAAAVAADPYRASSILMGSIAKAPNGEDYTPVWGTPKAPNEVQLIVDSSGNTQYKLTEEQNKTVEDYLIDQAKSVLNTEVKVQTSSQLRNDALDWAKLEEEKRKARKEESIVNNNSDTLGELLGKVRGRSQTELSDFAQSVALYGGFENGTYDYRDGGSLNFTSKDPQTLKITKSKISIGGKNTESLIQDVSAVVRSKVGEGAKIDWGRVESTAIKTAKELGKQSSQGKAMERF